MNLRLQVKRIHRRSSYAQKILANRSARSKAAKNKPKTAAAKARRRKSAAVSITPLGSDHTVYMTKPVIKLTETETRLRSESQAAEFGAEFGAEDDQSRRSTLNIPQGKPQVL